MASSENSNERAWYLRRGFIIAAAVLVVIIIMGIVVIVIGPPDKGATASPTTPPGANRSTENVSPPIQVPTTAPAATGSTCGPTTVQLDGTVTTAPAAQWALVGTTYAPQSAAVGPGRTASDGLRECFARTPQGALFAAANLLAMGSEPQLVKEMTRNLTVPGRGRDTDIQQQATARAPATTTRYQLGGFKILAYDGTSSRIDLAVIAPNLNVSIVYDLRWYGGQWMVVPADDGQAQIPGSQLSDLSGYVLWQHS